jgi:hypothetical protein
VSWHYTIDDKVVVNHLPLDEEGYHAHEDANMSSIGIEICMNEGIDRAAADLRAARLAAALLYDLRLDADVLKKNIRIGQARNVPSCYWLRANGRLSRTLSLLNSMPSMPLKKTRFLNRRSENRRSGASVPPQAIRAETLNTCRSQRSFFRDQAPSGTSTALNASKRVELSDGIARSI